MRRRDEQEELMALVDTDGDDCIDLEEFIAVCGGEPVFASNAVRCTNSLVEGPCRFSRLRSCHLMPYRYPSA